MAISTGITNKAAISAISLLDKRDILKNAVDTTNEEGLTDIMQLSGRMKPAKVGIYHDYTEDPLYQLLDTTGATVTGSGTATVTTTFTVATSGYITVGDLVILPTNEKVAQAFSVTPSAGQDTVVFKSVDGSNLTHTAGEKLSPFSNVAGEASKNPTNRKYGWTKFFNLVQTFRGVNEITDIQDVSEIELEFGGQNYVFNRDIANKFIKFKADINAAFIAGRQSVTQYSDASPAFIDPVGGGAQQTTMGLNQYTTTYGVNGQVASLGSITFADVSSYLDQLTAARAPKKYFAWGSSAVLGKVDDLFKNLGSSGYASGRLNVDGKILDFDVNTITYKGYTIQFGVLPILDHPVLFSQTSFIKSLYFVPDGKINTKMGSVEDRISVRYLPRKEKGYGNDIYQEWDEGALARSGPVGSQSIRRTNWVSTQGLHILGASQFGKFRILS